MVSDDVKSMLATLKADLESGAMSPCVWDADSNPACAGGGASAPALAPPEVTEINVCTAPAYTALPNFVAIDMGVFESFGFTKVEKVACGTGPATAAAMIAGEADFAINTPDNMLVSREAGFDLVMFSQALNGHFFDILVAADQPVVDGDWEATMQALDGTNVGVVARGAAAEQIARQLFESAGLDPENSTYIATGLGGTTIASMEAGEIDWAITFEPGMTMGVKNGIGTRPFSLVAGDGPSALDWPSLVLTATRDFAAANPNTIAAYQAALEASIAWLQDDANTDAVLQVMADNVALVSADMAADVHAANKGSFLTDGTLDPNRIGNVIDYALGRGLISKAMNFADFAITAEGVPEKLVMPDPEVTAGFDGTTIKIGVVNDFSGPAAIIGLPLQSGVATYYEWVNAQGGIAGKYPVELVDADSTYNPSVAVQAYNDMKDEIALIGNLFGTPVVTALLESLNEDGLMAVPASLESGWVRESNLMPWGAPYQIQVINGIDWWLNEGGGSTDQVYCSLIQDDPYGEAGQAGLEWIAPKVGITITEVARYVPGDSDFSAQIGQLQGSGCEVVWLTALPSAVGGIGGAAAGAGFAPTWIGQSPVWINAFAASALAPYLEANLIIVGEGSTWGDTSMPGAVAMMERMATYAPDQAPDYYFAAGYVMGMAGAGILEQAVANGDLSREGILQASTEASIDFEGLSGDYHYGPVDERQPSISNTIFRVNPEVPNGVEAVEVGYESSYASDYDF
jgi:ABC-type nitrate/sulfonate/bicarbonate transport system substrate-binding protein/ABC-type branched-subunit amino acid transport system substrate-binding protein